MREAPSTDSGSLREATTSDVAFACVVLAAGAGTRFGAPKAVAALPDGTRFVDAVTATAIRSGAEPVIAVLPPGFIPPEGASVVTNPDSKSEQIVSLRLGLARLANSAVAGALVWPVDCPLVRRETVVVVVNAGARSDAPVAIPVHDGKRGHPTYFARATWPELMAAAHGGARSVIQQYGEAVTEVPVNDPGVLADLDTSADLQRALNQREAAGE